MLFLAARRPVNSTVRRYLRKTMGLQTDLFVGQSSFRAFCPIKFKPFLGGDDLPLLLCASRPNAIPKNHRKDFSSMVNLQNSSYKTAVGKILDARGFAC